MYYTLRLSAQEYAELLTLLNVLLLTATDDGEKASIRTWIHRLSQMEPEREVRE